MHRPYSHIKVYAEMKDGKRIMKLLWVCNLLIPQIAEKMNYSGISGGSWLTGIYEELKEKNDVELIYLYPDSSLRKSYAYDNVKIIAFTNAWNDFSSEIVDFFSQVLQDHAPDVIHIFGTEYAHSRAIVEAAERTGNLHKVVVSIQGLVSVYSKHFYGYLPYRVTNGNSIYESIKRNGLKKQQNSFVKRGWLEEEVLRKVKHVIGRTDWDKACVERINPDVIYHHCNENMRNSFYQHQWNFENCEKHSIFLSQCYYPIKGLHLVLEAMADLIKWYPDIQLYTTGNFNMEKSAISKIRRTQYQKYCMKLIKENGLEGHITFLGSLDEQAMCQQFLKANVFVCASSIENSPNSLGEAMLLGVPVISSDVGGVKNMMTHNQDGFIYQADATYMLAYYIKWIFENQDKLGEISQSAREHAMRTHNRIENMRVLFDIYYNISKKNNT